MGIQLTEDRPAGYPGIKRRALDWAYMGAIVRTDQRDRKKPDGEVVMNSKGKPSQELIVTLYTIKSTMMVGRGDELWVPEEGEIVRDFQRGGGFAAWITALKELGRPLEVGDIYVLGKIDQAILYSPDGSEIKKFGSQAEIDAHRMAGKPGTIGFRGPLKIRPAKPEEQKFVGAAEAAYMATKDKIQLSTADEVLSPQAAAAAAGYAYDDEPF